MCVYDCHQLIFVHGKNRCKHTDRNAVISALNNVDIELVSLWGFCNFGHIHSIFANVIFVYAISLIMKMVLDAFLLKTKLSIK